MPEDELLDYIENDIIALQLEKQRIVISTTLPYSLQLLELLLTDGYILTLKYLNGLPHEEKGRAKQAIKEMVAANISVTTLQVC